MLAVFGDILGFLTPKDVHKVRQVCKKWQVQKARWQTLNLAKYAVTFEAGLGMCFSRTLRWLKLSDRRLSFLDEPHDSPPLLDSHKILDKDLLFLSKLAGLDTLILCDCNSITDAGVAHLAALSNLESLDVSQCKQIRQIVRLPTSLRELAFDHATDSSLACVAALVNLRVLRMPHGKMTDAGLAHIAGLLNLWQLDLFNCAEVTDAGMAHVATLPKLRFLILSYCSKVTDAGLFEVAQMKLWRIKFDGCGTDVGYKYFNRSIIG